MDMSYITKREETSLSRAKAAGCLASQKAHEGMARAYGKLRTSGTISDREVSDPVLVNA